MQRILLSAALGALLTGGANAANHREAPITALDHKADITDVYAFRSYGTGDATPKVTLIMGATGEGVGAHVENHQTWQGQMPGIKRTRGRD